MLRRHIGDHLRWRRVEIDSELNESLTDAEGNSDRYARSRYDPGLVVPA